MKNLLIIRPHSFIDLITNSSSELFIYSGNKSVELVKQFLIELVRGYNKLIENDKIDKSKIFTEIFQEPELAEYNFDYNTLPLIIRKEYEKYNYVPSNYDNSYSESEEYRNLRKKEEELKEKIGLNEKDLFENNIVKYGKLYKEFYFENDKLWNNWDTKKSLSELNLVKHVLVENKLDSSSFYNTVCNLISQNRKLSHEKDEIYYKKLYKMNLYNYINYNTIIKKGDILIYSAKDNSVPYELMESIESYLNAVRYHLG